MGKRGAKKLANTQSGSHNPISMIEEAVGKTRSKGGGANLKSVLRHEHLKNLAAWFTGGDASIPSMAAFFGRRLAGDAESAAIAPDPQLFSCQRCETVLQPGFNCTVRIEKTPVSKHVRRKKSNVPLTQNNVVYNCHFCSYRNVKRGTTKGHMKEICPTKQKTPPPRPKTTKDLPQNKCVDKEKDTASIPASPERTGNDHMENSDVNTLGPMLTLERSRRKRKSRSGKPVDPESVSAVMGPEKTVGGSSKRKRKSWTSLKEIAERDRSSSALNLKIPFLL